MRLGTGFLFGVGLQFFLAAFFAVLKNRLLPWSQPAFPSGCFYRAENRFLPWSTACFSLPVVFTVL